MKTLKDIEYGDGGAIVSQSEELQEAAKKWIKELEGKKVKLTPKEQEEWFEKTGERTDTVIETTFDGIDKEPIIDWIKEFFNLEEKE